VSRVTKIRSALKHGVYTATAVLPGENLGCVLINPALKALVAECPLRSESDRNTALPRYDAMCH